jgi:hypothetical protein
MIKCRLSTWGDQITIENTTSSKIDMRKEGYFCTVEELRELFCSGYLFKDLLPINEAFDQWLASKIDHEKQKTK